MREEEEEPSGGAAVKETPACVLVFSLSSRRHRPGSISSKPISRQRQWTEAKSFVVGTLLEATGTPPQRRVRLESVI